MGCCEPGESGRDSKTGNVGWDVIRKMRVGEILQQVGMGHWDSGGNGNGTLYNRWE